MLRQTNIQLQVTQVQGGGKTRDDDCGQHGSHDDVQEIVSRVKRGNSNHHGGNYINDSSARHVVVKEVANAGHDYPPGQIRHGSETNDSGDQQRRHGPHLHHAPDEDAGFARAHLKPDQRREDVQNLQHDEGGEGCWGKFPAHAEWDGDHHSEASPL